MSQAAESIIENLRNRTYGVNPMIALADVVDRMTAMSTLEWLVSEGIIFKVKQNGMPLYSLNRNFRSPLLDIIR